MHAYPMTLLVLVVDTLAVYRLARLICADQITAPPRNAIIRWAYRRHGMDADVLLGDLGAMVDADMAEGVDVPPLAYLVRCRVCAAVWCAAGVVLWRCAWPAGWSPVAVVLAVAAVAAVLPRVEE